MGKTNWTRVFLGGSLAGVVFIVLGGIANRLYLQSLFAARLETLNPSFQETIGFRIFWVIFYLIIGFVAVWLYSAIRPRYGTGPKTALIAGLVCYLLCGLSYPAVFAVFGFFPARMFVPQALTHLVTYVIATLVGAWVYEV